MQLLKKAADWELSNYNLRAPILPVSDFIKFCTENLAFQHKKTAFLSAYYFILFYFILLASP